MSLTQILKHKVSQNLRSWFKYHFPNPGLYEKKKILIQPSFPPKPNNGEVGTALDYLIRFHLERKNKKVIHKNNGWVAQEGLNRILLECDTSSTFQMKIGTDGNSKIVEIKPFRDKLTKDFEKAKKDYLEFIKTGALTTNLIKSSIFLSKLDARVRPGIIDVNIDNIGSNYINEINEIKELVNITPWDKFNAEKHCYLNPNFGEGSKFVNGADADLIIDDVLIDIKSSKNFKLQRNDLNQIIGYCLLSHIGDINNNEDEGDIEIKEVAIYFARYGYFWKKPLSDFYELDKYDELTDEFKILVKNPRIDLVKDKPKRLSWNLPNNSPFS